MLEPFRAPAQEHGGGYGGRLARPGRMRHRYSMTGRFPNPLLFGVAVLAGASFWPASHALPHGAMLAAWKGAGVGLLAMWVLLSRHTLESRWIAVVLALGALGDVLLETSGLTVGAVAFLIGHVLAAALYWRNRRSGRDGWVVAIPILIGVPLCAYASSANPGVLVYAVGLGTMAGTAWLSRFPRQWVAAGGLLFAVSDLLIFARMGPLAGSGVPGLLIWPLYFIGQATIAFGVVAGNRMRAPIDRAIAGSAA